MARHLISELTVIEAARAGQKTLTLRPNTIVTDAARDKAAFLGLRIVQGDPSPAHPADTGPGRHGSGETIAIGSDHGGFQLKKLLIPFIEGLGHKVVDVGTYSDEACDYPEFAYMVARMVSLGEASRGIMIDSIGTASAVVANKVPGIRAACCLSEFVAQSSREHNDSNVLTLGGRILGTEIAKAVVLTWLKTWFGGGRHKARLDKISEIERRYAK